MADPPPDRTFPGAGLPSAPIGLMTVILPGRSDYDYVVEIQMTCRIDCGNRLRQTVSQHLHVVVLDQIWTAYTQVQKINVIGNG